MDQTLGDRELDVLHVLWRDGDRTVAEVRDALDADLAYTTVLTILRNLEAKGFVVHTVDGRAHRYAAAVDATAVHEGALQRVLRSVFRGDAFAAIARLVARERLDADELRSLSALVDARLRETRETRDGEVP
ncbi:MAG: BlaI/MecI/CopY family transcriptional regulator [Gemmatimonadaceae bacterium]|jgi:predicted transcriptional regulator|nr:BlaI/MecI/CopY family transcriptional regulator [Gemmatimonadaceae bacterium]